MKEQERAFLELIERYKRLIYKVCYMHVSDNDTINDLFQETVLNLWRAFPSFRGDSKEDTWIYRVALNTCISQFRKRSRKPACISLDVQMDVMDSESDEEQMIRQLYQMIHKLEPLDKALILLYLDDKPYEEIAHVMGMTRTNVGVKLLRIREKLKQMYNQEA